MPQLPQIYGKMELQGMMTPGEWQIVVRDLHQRIKILEEANAKLTEDRPSTNRSSKTKAKNS